jgi:hypothetical protein
MTDAQCLALAQSIRTILAELAERSSEALKNDSLRKAQKDLGVVASQVALVAGGCGRYHFPSRRDEVVQIKCRRIHEQFG